jgi:hypothetical protein
MQWRGKHAVIITEILLGNDISCGFVPRLYNEDLRQLRREFSESLEVAVEDDGEEKT